MKAFLRAAFTASLLGAVFLTADPSLARGVGMGGGMGTGAGIGGFGARSTGSARGQFGGASGSHLSAQGSANTNGPNALDRDTGLDRAQDRMSDQGAAHNKARANHASDKDTDDKPTR